MKYQVNIFDVVSADSAKITKHIIPNSYDISQESKHFAWKNVPYHGQPINEITKRRYNNE
jgi:hypothetical protein